MAERRIRYYLMVNEQGERFPNQIDFDALLDDISGLADAEAYVQLARFEVLGSAYRPPRGAGRAPAASLAALDRITRDVRLRIERQRGYRPLVLGSDESLAEPTFASLFPNNVLGVMRNSGSAPSVSSFRDYINNLKLLSQQVEIIPLADKNALRALNSVERLTKVYVAVGPEAAADIFTDAPSIGDTIHAIRNRLGYVTIEMAIKLSPASGVEASEEALREVRNIVRGDALNHVDKASMSYRDMETGRAATYDFIDESIVTEVAVEISDDTHQPTEPSVAEAFMEGYERAYEDIASALKSLGIAQAPAAIDRQGR